MNKEKKKKEKNEKDKRFRPSSIGPTAKLVAG
jgi:hypothetical protein